MKLLEIEFQASGHFLRQNWRGTTAAVYARSLSPEHEPHELELIVIQIKQEGRTPSGSYVPEREAYPSPSEWGRLAWSFPVRYKEWVLDLGQKLLAISKDHGSFVRAATTAFKRSQAFQG